MAVPTSRRQSPDEIDLRGVVAAWLRAKWLIVGFAILLGVIAFLLSLILPKRYEAVTQVTITQPVFMPLLSGTNAFAVTPRLPDIRALQDLALADDLVRAADDARPRARDVANLKVRVPSNTHLQLEATDPDPQRAAALANRWGVAVARRLNELFGVDEHDCSVLEGQLAHAEAAWQQAAKDLVALMPEIGLDALNVRCGESARALSAHISKRNSIELLISDAQAMSARLTGTKDTDHVSTEVAIALITLQQRAVGASGGLQVQVGSPGLASELPTIGNARTLLGELAKSLERQRDELNVTIARIEAELSDLARRQASASHQSARLSERRDLALLSYRALSLQMEEMRIFLAQNGNTARLMAPTLPPDEPISPRPKLNAAIGVVLGFLLAVLFVTIREWWRAPAQP